MTKNKINVIFMGTPEIGAVALETLYKNENFNILCVISQPDKNFNRKKQIVFGPVKNYCIRNNIKLLQPENVNHILEEIRAMKPDVIITCAFGQFLSTNLINIPKYNVINLHASLLPKLRGGAPIHWAIINGYKETGVTIMKTIKKMDAGPFYKSKKVDISFDDTYDSLYHKLCNCVIDLINNDLYDSIINPNWIEQNENDATFAYNLTKNDRYIDFNLSSELIYNKIRGLYSNPSAIWNYNNLEIKILESSISSLDSTNIPGTIEKIDKTGIYISTNDKILIIKKIQLPGKNPINIGSLINGKHPFNLINKG